MASHQIPLVAGRHCDYFGIAQPLPGVELHKEMLRHCEAPTLVVERSGAAHFSSMRNTPATQKTPTALGKEAPQAKRTVPETVLKLMRKPAYGCLRHGKKNSDFSVFVVGFRVA
jgi:hypothetical protein